jgi:hypothetical protein
VNDSRGCRFWLGKADLAECFGCPSGRSDRFMISPSKIHLAPCNPVSGLASN